MKNVLNGAVLRDELIHQLRDTLRSAERSPSEYGNPGLILSDLDGAWLRLEGSTEMFRRLLAALESKGKE